MPVRPPVLLDVDRRRRDHHAQPPRRDEQPRRRDQGGAARRRARRSADDPAARCVVLTGTGRAFCVGQDLKEHVEILAERRRATRCSAPSTSTTTRSSPRWPAMAKPVIAAVNGVAAGAGASLAFACDLRIVADTAGFNLAFANVALSCDTGSSLTLQRLVGPGQGDRAALLPAHRQGRRGAGARAGHPGRARPTSSRRGRRDWRPGSPPARRSRSARCGVGGVRRRPHLRGVAGVRVAR